MAGMSAVRCGGNPNLFIDPHADVITGILINHNQESRRRSSVAVPNRNTAKISMSMAGTAALTRPVPRSNNSEFERCLKQLWDGGRGEGSRNNKSVAINSEKLDGWMRGAVRDIVNNLQKAPLFVHVYGDGTRMETEKAVEEEWPAVKTKWERGEAPSPEGVIFVEELKDEEEDKSTKAWGVVVQGRGGDCPPACYLLKTCSVSTRGIGACCTHYSLIKVSSFRETAATQYKNFWLVR